MEKTQLIKQKYFLLKQKSGVLVKQKPNYKLEGFQGIIEPKYKCVQTNHKGDDKFCTKMK